MIQRIILSYNQLSVHHLPLCLVLIFLLQSNGYAHDHSQQSVYVKTRVGILCGVFNNGVYTFKGVPYGENTAYYRFQPPRPVQPWNGVREAKEYGPIAPQANPNFKNPLNLPVSEDCLTLNIWTTGINDTTKRPVLVWFHGGAYSNGTANELLTDGTHLSKRGNVVVVSVNHRLNIFGFLYLAEIGNEKYRASGNVGMLDLVLALQWIQENIAVFGGDPKNVTIFGQSGGGAKCATLMAMPAAQGLFHKVLTMSGQQLTGRRRSAATATAKRILTTLHISEDSLHHLDNLPTALLTAAIKGQYFGPVTDGYILPRDPFDPDASPLSAHIPMIMGNTHDETTTLIGLTDTITFSLNWEQVAPKLTQHVQMFLGPLNPDSLVALYRQWYPTYSPSDVFFAITTAARSWRSMVIQSERRALQMQAPTYVYQFDWKSPVHGGRLRAGHGMDIPFFFNNTDYGRELCGTGDEQERLAEIMCDVLIAFARTGNPNIPAIPHWEPFNLERRQTMIFTIPPRIEDDPRGNERTLFAPIPYVQPGTL